VNFLLLGTFFFLALGSSMTVISDELIRLLFIFVVACQFTKVLLFLVVVVGSVMILFVMG